MSAENTPSASGQRIGWVILTLALWLLALLGLMLLMAAFWISTTFGTLSVDQLLANMQGAGGEGGGGDEVVRDAVLTIIVAPTLMMVFLAALGRRTMRTLCRSQRLTRGRRRFFRLGSLVLTVGVLLSGAGALSATIGFDEYTRAVLREHTTDTSIADFYIAPHALMSPVGVERPKNLVLIYLESIEVDFADAAVFGENMLQPLDAPTRGWNHIQTLQQYDGGGWTMSGFVSTQCGIPLRTSSSVVDIEALNELGSPGEELASYLPGARCLGDVLAEAGYQNTYIGGADTRFAGKGTFLSTHGYTELKDLRTWKALGETEIRPDWGLSDRRLMAHAREEVTRLHDSGKPFNLTMLTLDTHEGEHVFPYCEVTTPAAMTSMTRCSMQEVAEFVQYMRDHGYLEDTVVVLMGDHLKMLTPHMSLWKPLHDVPERSIYNAIWSPEATEIQRTEIDQLSMYPTLLELLGFQLTQHRAGIGVSALAEPDAVPPGSVLELSQSDYTDLVRSRSSAFFERMWTDDSANPIN